MPNFTLSIQDDRHQGPVFRWLVADSEARARVWAAKLLGESSHHLGVTCLRDGTSLFEIRAENASSDRPTGNPPVDARGQGARPSPRPRASRRAAISLATC